MNFKIALILTILLSLNVYASNHENYTSKQDISKKTIQSKVVKPKITDFSNDSVSLNGMYYSTIKKDISHSKLAMKCADGMMVDIMNSWKKNAINENKLKEFSLLRDKIYTAMWNAAADDIESNLVKDKETVANTIFMCKMLASIQKSLD